MKTHVWLVHDGTIEGIMGAFYDETQANMLCADLNTSTTGGKIYSVTLAVVEDSEGVNDDDDD